MANSSLDAGRIKEIVESLDLPFRERQKTIYTVCPLCEQDDKLSIRKWDGLTICYRGSCQFGGPRPFYEWVMLTCDISREDAIARVHGNQAKPVNPTGLKLNLIDPDEAQVSGPPREAMVPTEWPLPHAHSLMVPEAADGASYLASRGVPLDVAHTYGIQYSSLTRRVIFPVVMNNGIYGWQARAVDPVKPGDRMRNNPGFQRARCVLFLDRVQSGAHAIIAEGPFDAIKFHHCGGNVCTMGKVVSREQVQLILSKNPSAIYLALDDDAAPEMRDLAATLPVPVYRITVPDHVAERCAVAGKKADFGECTMAECVEAFRNAKPFGLMSTALYLKKPWE